MLSTPHLDLILQRKHIEQRTEKWFEIRKDKITGSIIDCLSKTDKYKNIDDCWPRKWVLKSNRKEMRTRNMEKPMKVNPYKNMN